MHRFIAALIAILAFATLSIAQQKYYLQLSTSPGAISPPNSIIRTDANGAVVALPNTASPNYAQVHAPAGVFTTNTGGVQGGYGLVITPIRSGVVYLHASGDLASDTTGFGASIQFDYGTGTPPAQGVIAPAGNGQMIGNHLTVYLAGEPTSEATGTVIYVLSGLTLGTPYWVDLVIAAVDGGTGRFYNMSIVAIEQ